MDYENMPLGALEQIASDKTGGFYWTTGWATAWLVACVLFMLIPLGIGIPMLVMKPMFGLGVWVGSIPVIIIINIQSRRSAAIRAIRGER